VVPGRRRCVSPPRSARGHMKPRLGAFEAFELQVGPVSLRRPDQQRTNPQTSFYSRRTSC
jgi:hypothetical protein